MDLEFIDKQTNDIAINTCNVLITDKGTPVTFIRKATK
jgi:hypothetical protein